ncbi:GNAT family N-acetyltransferase [Afifella aestuarii]|uniref:GNAT family N-acetyltransferase n=1 Tax=Afifella aestuarii TaxID=1909496 RepID=UPI000FE39E8D|nr:GNAT family N-acetyltransferase [Afifella aestuarii]
MVELVIRRAKRGDLAALIAIFAADDIGGHGDTLHPAALPSYQKAFEELAGSPDECLYVAEQDGEVIGTFQLGFRYSLPDRGALKATLEAVQVRPAERGQGIGGKLVRFAIAEARRKGAHSLSLTSNNARRDAHRFYERLGFQNTHRGYKLFLD